jgi:hypothetical protein
MLHNTEYSVRLEKWSSWSNVSGVLNQARRAAGQPQSRKDSALGHYSALVAAFSDWEFPPAASNILPVQYTVVVCGSADLDGSEPWQLKSISLRHRELG